MSTAASNPRPDRPAPSGTFPLLLKTWRQRRRFSQLELSLSCRVSQRHLSFLESGRSAPSRSMILQLCEALDVPLRERNSWLLSGGFAPAFTSHRLDDPQMLQVLAAVERMLSGHEPFPALAVDRAWNVRLSNRSFDRLVAMLGEDAWARTGSGDHNLMRLLFHPCGIRPFIANWASAGPLVWHRAEREAEALGGHEMAALLDELRAFQDSDTLDCAESPPLVPVLPLVIERDGVRISLFSVISTFGTAQDVTADELRIESFFPADEATEALFRSLAGS
jgi:transcriptional regulator with XRE-family HTH domain